MTPTPTRCRPSVSAATLLVLATLGPMLADDGEAPSEQAATSPTIRFHGFVPGSVDPSLEGKFTIEFRLYKSPQGGEPVWRETREVEARRGRIDVRLGEVRVIPFALHEATFKWIGASVDGRREIYPRYHVVNVVYASAKEALLGAADAKRRRDDEAPYEDVDPRDGTVPDDAGLEPDRRSITARSEAPATWREALDRARARGGDLPDFEEWYHALEAADDEQRDDMAGHYEWVLPWVYDTASHGRYNRYFRGRYEGCDYMDLSPEKSYRYRMTTPAPREREGDGDAGEPHEGDAAPSPRVDAESTDARDERPGDGPRLEERQA